MQTGAEWGFVNIERLWNEEKFKNYPDKYFQFSNYGDVAVFRFELDILQNGLEDMV